MTDSTQATIPAYKSEFLKSCLSANVLTFGTYTLKSGRQSPYFFNAGSFHTAPLLASLSTAYAYTIISYLAAHPEIPKPDILFGPAYKGIPLACSTLHELYRIDPETWSTVSYSFNRKEAKDHGEGGNIVGALLKGKNILVIDDVITAGTAMRETLDLVDKQGGKVVMFVVALDRVERIPGPREKEGIMGESKMSAIGQIRNEYGVQTASIVTLDDLIILLKNKASESEGEGDLTRLEAYRSKYLASD
ncbi:orotate phosphoribosyltransferase [Phlyctema vagabunda]|uniref:Orotate phosphoribosyltransferase n=1 Tax=Phlyctema vagabunda TaxID=108571 RepID=A0ABR4PH15_9HELO